VAFTLTLALWGYRQGLIVGALTLAGFGAGALLGGRAAPFVLSQGAESPYAPLFAALGALMTGSLVALALEGLALGLRARLIRGQGLHFLDGAFGAALIASVALGLAWLFGAVALHAPGAADLRGDVQRSLILRNLNQVLPPSGPLINALNRVDPAPEVLGQPAQVARPDPAIASDPDVQRAGNSVVRVLGTACGLGLEGSGWAAGPGLFVTNAHVIAGEDDTTVSSRDGTTSDAVVVLYDRRNDLALLRADLDLRALPFAPRPRRGAAGAVLGYPENGPFTATPARFGGTQMVLSEDAYGRGPLNRRISSLRGEIRSGNSGGPMVDKEGRVLGTVFAATASGVHGGFTVPNDVVGGALRRAGEPVGTGPCAG
jgi:S1-C subfamily serine protease